MYKRVALFLLLALSSPAAAQSQEPVAPVQSQELTLRPGDVIRVQIWREEDLSGEFPVNEDGIVVLPLIGEQQASGVPLRELRQRLVRSYEQHLRNPSINVVPLRRVNVLGEVQRPGLYPVDPTVSLAEAIALAGGATNLGDIKKIQLVRGDTLLHKRVGAGSTLQDVDIRSGDQIIVGRRSWFERNSTFLVSATLSVTSIVISILRN